MTIIITDTNVFIDRAPESYSLQCMVLSGDGDLRKECTRHGLEVHGSLWVIKELWIARLVEQERLLIVLDALERNTRLPMNEMEKLRIEIAGDE